MNRHFSFCLTAFVIIILTDLEVETFLNGWNYKPELYYTYRLTLKEPGDHKKSIT